MPTASYLIADMQTKLGDPSGAIFSSANLLNWLNESQKRFSERTTALRRVDATSIATGLNAFPMPSDRIIMDGLWSRKQIGTKLKALTWADFGNQQAACPGAVGYDSDSWSMNGDSAYVHPAYGTSAARGLLSNQINSTVTTIPMISTSTLKSWGRVRIDSEEIEYAHKDSFNLYGCSRGLGGTTAATHFKGTFVTQLDLWMVYRHAPITLATVTDTPEIPSVFHEKLEHYVMYLAYTQVGEMEKAKDQYEKWDACMKIAEYIETKEHCDDMMLHDVETQLTKHLMGPR